MQMVLLGAKDPKQLLRQVLRLPLKTLFWKGIRYRNLRRALVIFTIAMALQLRVSRRARGYAKKASILLLFCGTFFGFLVTVVLFGIKLRMHKSHESAVLRR